MLGDDDPRLVMMRAVVEDQVEATVDGVLANLGALEHKPADRGARARIAAHFVELDRLLSIRERLGHGDP
ncbi:MAG TPA: hypothetical protein VI997_04430 [Candidatus Thermoplasmatota archaeon]|nr:hypothetical protein [Candidatus Thermoplasmatota archaeon]